MYRTYNSLKDNIRVRRRKMIRMHRFRWIGMILFLCLLCSLTACDRQETGEEQRYSANVENAENMSGAPAEDISVSQREEYSAESEDTSNPVQTLSGSSDSALNKAFQAVLLGNFPFIYCSDGNAETMVITDVPALFDADDPLMKIFEFSVVDLNRDGEDEVILFVAGAAGDMGEK